MGRPQQGHPFRVQPGRELERRLPTELSEDPQQRSVFGLTSHDGFHVFVGEGLEIQAIRCIEIRADGFGIAVDEDGFHTRGADGLHRLHTAAVELHALPDAVGS